MIQGWSSLVSDISETILMFSRKAVYHSEKEKEHIFVFESERTNKLSQIFDVEY